MNDGMYSIYMIQGRKISESPWLKPQAPLKKIPTATRGDWFVFNWDSIGYLAEPWEGQKSKFKETSDEVHKCWSLTGHHGYFKLSSALLGIERVRAGTNLGKLDSRDSYGKQCNAQRYEFRLAWVQLYQYTHIVVEPKKKERKRYGLRHSFKRGNTRRRSMAAPQRGRRGRAKNRL